MHTDVRQTQPDGELARLAAQGEGEAARDARRPDARASGATGLSGVADERG